MNAKIAPSILSADLGRLAEEIRAVERAGADWIHLDVMDGRFVPNITVGPLVVRAARAATTLPLDVHLMIDEPDRHLQDFADAGADYITVHLEACLHLHRSLQNIRRLEKKAGIAVNPATPVDDLKYVLDLVDLVLIMSVDPGFGGQKFIDAAVPKIQEVNTQIQGLDHPVEISVDGGIGPKTSGRVMKAGASVLVAGTAIYGTDNYAEAIKQIRQG